ncbi:Methyltransferase domain-containing protein [Micromonospora nigra]|uniref:Methyltransferase domain-containing protein n=1 Tax=Micromonospora nigra TaxID=145857 RepID=A0A1C6S3A7_9ACTN|nr:class I SAM-dependent methyltransferase [Micromonospora nigra]SCL23908.1 Methyltransferase domain-containing protein [Micromonospora nigra]
MPENAVVSDERTRVDWTEWQRRWDDQQTGYLPHREARFEAMFDVLAEVLPEDFVALDLAGGPGSLGRRLLARFPAATCVSVDFDPVLLEIGRQSSTDLGDRLRFVDADISRPDLLDLLGLDQVDAVLSSTALHWLPPHALVALYGRMGTLLRPGGILLNADNIPFGRERGRFQEMAEARRARHAVAAFGADMVSGWRAFWEAAEAEPALAAVSAERNRRFADLDRSHAEPILALHLAALSDAGFGAVEVVWQEFDDRVIAAIR